MVPARALKSAAASAGIPADIFDSAALWACANSKAGAPTNRSQFFIDFSINPPDPPWSSSPPG